MNEETTNPQKEKNTKNRDAITLKILLIGVLIVVLIIPMLMIQNLISEREDTAKDATNEVQQKWSGPQTIIGPILTLSYTYKDEEGKTLSGYVNYLPEHLDITGNVATQELKRGLYEIIVYNSSLELRGKFISKDLLATQFSREIKWNNNATLNLGVSDPRGISEQVSLTWNGQEYNLEPGVAPYSIIHSGISINLDASQLFTPGNSIDFSIQLETKGSGSMLFAPIGKTTNVALTSNCPTPSFTGAFLPLEREVAPDGFTSKWKVLEINRSFPQVFRSYRSEAADYSRGEMSTVRINSSITPSVFGVDLLFPVDHYQKSTRSAKYAFLIIVLTFVVCFFVEIVQNKNIHPLQYLLVGLALCLFYTLLVSTSEHISFTWAYLISALATTTLITLYMVGILKIKKTALTIGGLLVCLYTYIFFLIQLETYALLAGSIGLFVILAIIMYFSQKINWHNN
ncbi:MULTISPECIES: cell envelope integrity protein CreD [Butyricimonas]|uniref:cell envelope integrity protein CreD n=1 Tax=Butyricimonas TaxID=574697 RepID=UPI0007FB349C|nr:MULTISPECIES: cell envelope integrity protein CreD [Butyricimonas]